MRAILDDMLDHLESGGRDGEVCAHGRCGANDYTFYLRLAWRRLELVYPTLRGHRRRAKGRAHASSSPGMRDAERVAAGAEDDLDLDADGFSHVNEHSRLLLLEERCFTWRKSFAFQPAECRGFRATDRYGRCCNAYMRTAASQRVEGGGRCGGGRRVFVVRDPMYNGTAFDAARYGLEATSTPSTQQLTPLPPAELQATGAAMCGDCRSDPANDRPHISGSEPPPGVRYRGNRAVCSACPPDACGAY